MATGPQNLFPYLYLLSVFTGGLCQLVFRDSPATSTVLVGYPTTLRCSARDPTPPEDILWFKDGVTVTPVDYRFTISYDSSAGDSELRISSVIYPDAGDYQCIAVGSSNQILAASSVGTLTVHGHPEFGTPLPSITVAVGGRVEFTCDVLSIPSATINWSYDSGGVQRNLTTGGRVTISPSTTLTITNVQESDEGYYICTAQNSFGRNATSGRLTVGTPPPPLTLSLSPGSPITVVQGDNTVITCSAPDGIHLTSIQWSRGSNITTGIARTANSLALTVSNVQLQDGGNYVCTAADSFGNMETVTAVLVIDVPPRITVAPSNLTVLENVFLNPPPPACEATGEPTPTYSWFQPNGSPIPIIGGVPQFGILTRSDSGTYTCVATNRAGQVRADFNIVVEGPPLFTLTPSDLTVSSGQDVTFRCEAVGPPAPTYTWTRVGRTLQSSAVDTGITLNLFSVSSDDAGVYQCTAGSSRGTINAQATLAVLSPPRITQATTTPLYLTIGTPFTLDCMWTGPPNSIQSWYLNGTLLSLARDPRLQTWPNGSLTVSNPSESYTGAYLCNITTGFEFVTSQVYVTVGEPPRITISPSSMDLAPGTTAFLSCVPNGFPQPWTTWFKTDIFEQRTQLPNFGTTFTKFSNGLQLHDVGREDSGMYECLVENRLGSMRQDAMVRVEGAPVASEVESVTLNEGAINASISCLTRFNFPEGTVTWFRQDGQVLPANRFSTGAMGQLNIASVLREDSGTFVCVIQNQYGQSSAMGTVSVNYAPSVNIPNPTVPITATLGQSFTLSCPSEGQPSPMVQWTPPSGLTQNRYRVELNGDLTVFAANAASVGMYTCVASNSVGSDSGQVEVIVRGVPVLSLDVTVLSSSTVFVLWTPRPGNIPQSYELEIRVVGAPNIPVMEFTSGGTSRSRTVQNLAGGTQYEFTIRPIYADGIAGTDVSSVDSTRETAPSGPPQNIVLLPLELSLYITWEEPAFTERGGTILTYDLFYRFAQSDPESTVPFMAELDIPHSATGQRSGNSSNPVQVFNLRELVEGQEYEVKIRAVTALGPGPNSTEIVGIPAPPRSYQPLNFLVTQNAVIAVGAILCGALLITILVLTIGLLVYIIRRHRVKTGKHETLVEEEEFEKRQRRREKRRKVISDPIPGMVEDGETKKKLSLRSKEGKILAAPKVIQKQDMAAKPKPGKKVKKVPRDQILISQNDDEDYESPYDDPADAIHEDDSIRKQRLTDSPRVKLRREKETNLYSEPVRRTKKKQRPPSDDESEDEEALPYDDVYEDVEMGGSEGTDDDPSEVYATISSEHKAKKRVKRLEQQQKEDLKEERKRKKMEQKMERERQKKEAKDRKAAEKKRKEAEKNKSKLSKEDKRRQSLGLGNIVRLQDVDFGSGDARAQAGFIDSATAALF